MVTRIQLISHFRNSDTDIENILAAQEIARDCLEYMKGYLKTGMDQKQIHQACEEKMLEKGSQGWWIHNDPALILFGDLTTYSGHEDPASLYAGKTVAENDLISIDVAPMIEKGWGDLARSFIMEKGKIVDWKDCHNHEIIDGMKMEAKLHRLFQEYVDENTTFSDLYHFIHRQLEKDGYYNCDYHDNFGHTIEKDQKDRITIADGVDLKIAAYNKPIPFEPHICKIDGHYGLKHENMYVYIDGRIEEI